MDALRSASQPESQLETPAAGLGIGPVRAYIDLGTNSARLILARFHGGRTYTVLSDQKEAVRLGEDEFTDGYLRRPAMTRAALVCRRFSEMAHAHGAQAIVAVATAATREARNRETFVRLLEREAGLEIRVVSGLEEARLIYKGVASGVHLDDRHALFVDVGGGSTELALGGQTQHAHLDSLKLGAVRLATLFTAPVDPAPITPDQYLLIRRFVSTSSVRSVQRIAGTAFDLAIGSSGTIQNLADIAVRRRFGRPRDRADVLSREDLEEVARELCRLDLEARRRVPGINPARADIIVAGAAIVESLMDELGIAQLAVSERGLREGMIEDDLDRRAPLDGATETDTGVDTPTVRPVRSIRERSVLDLVRRCGADEAHAYSVCRLALRLFDDAAEFGLHSLAAHDREMLGYGALVHDVGTFLSYNNHHLHSYYVVRNSDLLGFDESEIAMIAAIARFHRKGLPRKRHAEVALLDKDARRAVGALAVFVRLAESLDRTHAGLVHDVGLSQDPEGPGVLLMVEARAGCELEIWGAEAQAGVFERVFAKPLRVKRTAGPVPSRARSG